MNQIKFKIIDIHEKNIKVPVGIFVGLKLKKISPPYLIKLKIFNIHDLKELKNTLYLI